MKKFLFIILFLTFQSALISQEYIPNLIADRPDVTESAVTIPHGFYQLETGFIYKKQKFYTENILIDIDKVTIASTLLRYGINDFWELRFGGQYQLTEMKTNSIEKNISGLDGLFVGTKLQLWKDLLLTNCAIIIELDLPYGNTQLKPEKFEPTIMLVLERIINNNISFGSNFGYQLDSKEEQNLILFSGSLCWSISDRWGTFLEFFGNTVKNKESEYYISTGITYLQKQNLQLDFSTGTKLLPNKENTDWFVNFGFVLRIPK